MLEEEDLKTWSFANSTPEDAVLLEHMQGKTQTGGGAADPAAIGHHGHAAQFRDVAEAIETGRKPLIDGREGRRSVEIILAIYKSAETGKPVKLPLTSDPTLKARKQAIDLQPAPAAPAEPTAPAEPAIGAAPSEPGMDQDHPLATALSEPPAFDAPSGTPDRPATGGNGESATGSGY